MWDVYSYSIRVASGGEGAFLSCIDIETKTTRHWQDSTLKGFKRFPYSVQLIELLTSILGFAILSEPMHSSYIEQKINNNVLQFKWFLCAEMY